MLPDLDAIRTRLAREGSVVLELKVIPRAATSAVAGWTETGVLKVRVAAAPEKGKANEELCALLARSFGVLRRNVEIVSGHASHHKRAKIFL